MWAVAGCSGSGFARGSRRGGGASGMRPWFARGGFFSRSSGRCENTGRARKRVRANGITKRDFILASSEPMDVQKLTWLDRGLQVRRTGQVRREHASCCFETRRGKIEIKKSGNRR